MDVHDEGSPDADVSTTCDSVESDTTDSTRRRRLRTLPAWIIVAALAYVALIAIFPRVSDDITEISGVPCDLPVEGDGMCQRVGSSDDAAFPTALDLADRPFERIRKPSSEILVWSALGAFAVVSAVALGAAAIHWRKDLGRYPPEGGRLGAKSGGNLVAAAVLAGLGLAAAVGAALSAQYVQAIVLAALWCSAAPSIAAAADCWTIADSRPWMADAALSERVTRLRELGRLHDRFVALLGGQVTIYVLWLSADVEVKGSTSRTELARQGGDFLNDPHLHGLVVLWGAVLTGLLALAYFPAASAVRTHADDLVDETLSGLEETRDYAEFGRQRAALGSMLGADQPLQARFQGAVIVAAPLFTSLMSSLLGG